MASNSNIFDAFSLASSGFGSLAGAIIGGTDQSQQYDIQEQEERLAETERSLQRTQTIRQVLAMQNAQAGAQGGQGAVNSTTFRNVSQSSYNKFMQDEHMDALNLSFKISNIEAQKQAARDKEDSGILSGLANIGAAAATFLLL